MDTRRAKSREVVDLYKNKDKKYNKHKVIIPYNTKHKTAWIEDTKPVKNSWRGMTKEEYEERKGMTKNERLQRAYDKQKEYFSEYYAKNKGNSSDKKQTTSPQWITKVKLKMKDK